jgi:hypothetical protein
MGILSLLTGILSSRKSDQKHKNDLQRREEGTPWLAIWASIRDPTLLPAGAEPAERWFDPKIARQRNDRAPS